MTVQEILLLGNPKLYEVSEEVHETEIDLVQRVVQDLHDTMMVFREEYGVGRAIAAPQIGVMKRIIYIHIDRPVVFVNPVLRDLSREMIELWDDCMCFPELLVRVRRHRFCIIDYRDQHWRSQSMKLADDLSELLQHEYDHLEGILAVSRAIDGHSFSLTSQHELLQKS
ncbi:MAG: peptide deformylase [Candidatus Thorarchaeota archaeon]|nr:peptide deformylase [Candidatus Thorarchaeota archaeon]